MRVMDLPANPAPGVFMYCAVCQDHFSACRGDYFLNPPDEVVMCCEAPMELARRTVNYERLTPEEAELSV